MNGVIYGLCDPDTGELRYVGQTGRSLKPRLKERIRWALAGHQPAVSRWIGSLDGTEPGIIELERNPADLDTAERQWIASLRAAGCTLVNLTVGGSGFGGPHPPEVHTRPRSAPRSAALHAASRRHLLRRASSAGCSR